MNPLVPVLNHDFIHFLNTGKRPIAKLDHMVSCIWFFTGLNPASDFVVVV